MKKPSISVEHWSLTCHSITIGKLFHLSIQATQQTAETISLLSEVIHHIVDNGRFLELQALFANSIMLGFARLDGQTVGIVVNNPAENKGILNIDIIMLMSSHYNPEMAPPGKYLWIYSIALTDNESRDDSKVLPVIEETTKFMRKNFSTYSKDTEWELWTLSDEAYGIVPPIGTKRPNVKCPWIGQLYFVGDGYGEKRWGMGLGSAIHSAILCLDAVTGKNYSEQILPPYHRQSSKSIIKKGAK